MILQLPKEKVMKAFAFFLLIFSQGKRIMGDNMEVCLGLRDLTV
jgi:hypothetical protein